MNDFTISEIKMIIAKGANNSSKSLYKIRVNENKKNYIQERVNLVKTLKVYAIKYCKEEDYYNNVLYLSILYLDLILSKNELNLSVDKNLKYLCLCSFIIALKFIGNYNKTYIVIRNFVKNYGSDYRDYELYFLYLLDNNLIYTTSYDFLEMILEKDNKEILKESKKVLYFLCEQDIYTDFSPFCTAIAIYQYVQDIKCIYKRNYYTRYFSEEKVKVLYKYISYAYKNSNEIYRNNLQSPLSLESKTTADTISSSSPNNIKNISVSYSFLKFPNKTLITNTLIKKFNTKSKLEFRKKEDSNTIIDNNINKSFKEENNSQYIKNSIKKVSTFTQNNYKSLRMKLMQKKNESISMINLQNESYSNVEIRRGELRNKKICFTTNNKNIIEKRDNIKFFISLSKRGEINKSLCLKPSNHNFIKSFCILKK